MNTNANPGAAYAFDGANPSPATVIKKSHQPRAVGLCMNTDCRLIAYCDLARLDLLGFRQG
jgi:hypothetical protein